jgi:hypothetical protein
MSQLQDLQQLFSFITNNYSHWQSKAVCHGSHQSECLAVFSTWSLPLDICILCV